MRTLDTSFLVDYLSGDPDTKEYLAEHTNEPMYSPTLSLFEVYRGAVHAAGGDTVADIVDALSWVEPLPLDESAAREAALVEGELLDAGKRINLGDVLIAGVCRHRGTTLVSRDGHFQYVDGLDVEIY